MTEIEPWVEKTILLLRSKSEDAVDQLRIMLEESIRQKYGNRKSLKPIPGPTQAKKGENTSKKKKVESKKISISVRDNSSESGTSSSNDSDLAMEILEDDLACVVCREISIVSHNRLVECADCHSLYHQECHNPPIGDSDVNDPRVVWYCNSCNKSKPKVNSLSSNSSNGSSKNMSSNKSSSSKNGQSSSFSSKPFGGLSGKKSGSSSSSTSKSSSSSGSTKSVSPNMNIMNADKRLQIMKKKAAKKQEKRISK